MKRIFIDQSLRRFVLVVVFFVFATFSALAWNEAVVEVRTFDVNRPGFATIYLDIGAGFNEQDIVRYRVDGRRSFRLPVAFSELEALRIDPVDLDNSFTIESILLFHRGRQVGHIRWYEIDDYFTFVNVREIRQMADHIIMQPENDDPMLIANERMMEILAGLTPVRQVTRSSLYSITLLLLVVNIFLWRRQIICLCKKIYLHSDRGLMIALIAAFCLTSIMAWSAPAFSAPDETVTADAIRFYEAAIFPPDIRMPEVSHTFSIYGFSRLRELTLYYFFAGRVSALMRPLEPIIGLLSFRVFNIILFGHIILIAIKKRNQYPFLVIAALLTPQLWYLFSYATSDAFDYWLSFLAIVQIVDNESVLNRFLRGELPWRFVFIPGVLFGMLFLAKINFYTVLLTAFIMLAFRLFKTERSLKITILKKYIVIACCALMVFGLRHGVSWLVYGGSQTASISSLSQTMRTPRMNDETLRETLPEIRELRQSGTTLTQLAREYRFFHLLAESFTGRYGWMEFPSPATYTRLMFGLYTLLLGAITYSVFRNGTTLEKAELVLLVASMFLSLVAVIYSSWTRSFQPQGRYLFPAIMALIGCAALAPKLFEKKLLNVFFTSMTALSAFSFVFSGMLHVHDSIRGIYWMY